MDHLTETAPLPQDLEIIECFALSDEPPKIVPAAPLRNWMESVSGLHAYRCLPLTIANTYGWEILCPYDLAVDWTGGLGREDISIRRLNGDKKCALAHSNFAHGIITFHPGYIFRTPRKWHLMVTGPLNNPKRGIAPLSGVIETDWLPYPFTMNWAMTDPGTVVFEKDEPFCVIFPVERSAVTAFQPVVRNLESDPELKRDYALFLESRRDFLTSLSARRNTSSDPQWQRHYFLGQMPDGRTTEDHVRKLRAKFPLDSRHKTPPSLPRE
jgi:hypothetical protein